MQRSLPMFEDRKVEGAAVALTGSYADTTGALPALALEEEVVLVVRAFVSRVAHEEKDDVLMRTQTAKVLEVFVVDNDGAYDLMEGLVTERRKVLDDLLGRSPLPL